MTVNMKKKNSVMEYNPLQGDYSPERVQCLDPPFIIFVFIIKIAIGK